MATYAIRLGAPFAAELASRRTTALRKALKAFEGYPIEALPCLVRGAFDESPYLPAMMDKLYMRIGRTMAALTAERIGQKSARVALELKAREKPNPVWDAALKRFVQDQTTKKIVTIEGTMKDFVFEAVRKATEQVSIAGVGIEAATQSLIKNVMSDWAGQKEWMARRIMLTESMTAMSIGAEASAQALEIALMKTWTTAGINTREAHAAIDGETIAMEDYFFPGGEQMAYPRDDRFGASAENIINCSCVAIYEPA